MANWPENRPRARNLMIGFAGDITKEQFKNVELIDSKDF